MNIKTSLSGKRKLRLKDRRISITIFGKNNLNFRLLILSVAAASVFLSVWVNNNNDSNALALLYLQQKQQQLSGISINKVGYSSINEIPTFLSSYSDGAMAASSFSTSSSSSYNTATIPHLVMVDSLIGNLGKEINRMVQNSNDSTATLIVETHVINTN